MRDLDFHFYCKNMDRNKQVFLALKPKVKAYGFNRKELESVAANIANNLKLEENASEEEVNEAIEEAIKMADKKDIIVLAGKGHEPYQEINGVKNPFDERIIVKEILGEKKD